ncbi:motile sperm domain-containing protein 2-like [Galleria mellonella]|uniref:Motile sperm domain-containing protein 2-like n=1 Tax=Galleria mellonella TaxID=7137 RepID=A0ABM3MBC6_GALME|nr:motile sperm domain-containing protein 2-like [Galleria mellonella]
MATPADVRALFEAKLQEGVPNPPGEFNPVDLERVKNDRYMKRLLAHNGKQPQAAADMLWDILVWRKTVGASDITENSIRMDYIKDGTFYPRGRDIDGSLLFVLKAKLHVKGQKDLEELKKIIIYWCDRIEREENGKPITLFFDMDGCGLSNMDMELIKYLINMFKYYYPAFLNSIVIYQMPWVLSAAFKVVKSLLPAKAVERMKFISKDTLKDVVPPELAEAMSSKEEFKYEFVPESRSNSEQTPKKVTFAEQGQDNQTASQHSPGEMLRLNPSETIIFKHDNDDVSGQFTITNMDASAISFKIRTTSPEKFRVRPSSGVLPSGSSQVVLIVVQPGFQLRTVLKDRFLVMSVQIPKTDLLPNELADIWQNSMGSKVDEYRLKCHFPEKERNGTISDGKSQDKHDSVTNALNNLQSKYELLHRDVRKLKIFQFFTLFLTAVSVVLGYLVYLHTSTNERYCERM